MGDLTRPTEIVNRLLTPSKVYLGLIKISWELIRVNNLTYLFSRVTMGIHTINTYIHNINVYSAKSNPVSEPVTSCIKSANVVSTVTTPTSLAVQFYTISQKLTCPVNIFMRHKRTL